MEKDKKVGAGIGVMLVKERKLLLGLRHHDPNKADSELSGQGTWTMPGGKLEYGESFEQAAIREVAEETGIKLNNAKVICINNDKNENAHFVTIGLLSDDFEGEPKVMEPNEITEWKWFNLNKIPTPIFFPSKKILNNYKKKEFYIQE